MSDRRRRKSLSIFRPSLLSLTPISDAPNGAEETHATLKKKHRPASFFSPPTPSSPLSSSLERTNSDNGIGGPPSPQSRPRTLQKAGRPSSIFGSFRSLHSLQDEEESLVRTPSNSGSHSEEASATLDVAGMIVLHHGEVQTSGGMFRKRNQYLVLTNSHLLRFKSQSRASEVFPTIPPSLGRRRNSMRHSRMSSVGSLHELHATGENHFATALNQIVAVHKLDDGRPYFSIEISHLDEESHYASALTLQLSDPRESDLWLSSIRAALTKARLTDPLPFAQRTVEYVARALEQERDYDPHHFRMFKVVQRANKSGGRSSSDDLARLTSSICYLVIGAHKIHLVPVPKQKSASSTSLSDLTGASHGITTLISLSVQNFDDAFQLAFRLPLRHSSVLHLASSCVNDIALWIRQAAEYLRPEWLEQPFTWNVPQSLDDELLPIPSDGEDHFCFDRTLTAYCAGYDLDTSNIRYMVNYVCEDAPCFELLPPANSRQSKYNLLELLAVMRALRYNESFHSISFQNINLDGLHGLRDRFGSDHVPWTTRSGEPLNIASQEQSWLLVQEVRALVLKSKRLRRLNLSNCLTRKPRDEDNSRDPGCGICEAIFPLCARQATNVDWIVLNGIMLADVDIDYMFAAFVQKSCHFRALEVGRCGLRDRSLSTILQVIFHQEDTLESIDVSSNLARIAPENFHVQISRCGFIRKINLSNIYRSSSPEPLIAKEVLLSWRLEEANFSGTALNEQTVNAISAYLASRQSDTLRQLHLNQCNLTGKDVAQLLQSMARISGHPRDLHFHVSRNHLEQQHAMLVDAVARSQTPRQMTMQLLEYSNERNFAELIGALSRNSTLRYLDISKTSLPYDASDDTCEALRRMFAENRFLEELDISGEQAHLEVANLGYGLGDAILSLKHNKALKVVRIENQTLGLEGANNLASVLEVNSTLREIYCENNEINLQAFTVLVNSLKGNTNLCYFPIMEKDKVWSLKKVDREVNSLREKSLPGLPGSTKATVRRTVGAAIASGRSISGRGVEKALPTTDYTEQDVKAAVASLTRRWDVEVVRLQGYLARNYSLVNGLPLPEARVFEKADSIEKETALPGGSLTAALRLASLDRTPTAESDAQLGHSTDKDRLSEKIEPSMASNQEIHEDYGEKVFNLAIGGSDIEGALMMSRKFMDEL
ncbi:hypothetical protein MMC20_006755 [Loxospora ochrophaea]|nr:hypothetical protein [Loxospora ochrophaea]